MQRYRWMFSQVNSHLSTLFLFTLIMSGLDNWLIVNCSGRHGIPWIASPKSSLQHQFSTVLPCNRFTSQARMKQIFTLPAACYVHSLWIWEVSTARLLADNQVWLKSIQTDAVKLTTLNLPSRWTSPLSNRPLLLGYLFQWLFHCWMHLMLSFGDF